MTELNRDLAALRIHRVPQRQSGGRRVGIIGGIILLLTLGIGLWRWATRERPAEVELATVTERSAGTRSGVLNGSGYVTARRRATVSSKITGKVVELNVEEGMYVRENQVLARLDDSTAKAALALAEAQAEAARRGLRESEIRLEQARRTERRLDQLLNERVVGRAEVEQAKSEADALEARIGATREQIRVAERQIELEKNELSNTVIRAPFSGVAITRDAQPGEMVSPVSAGGGFTRTGICTIVDMKSLEITVDVNQSYINRVIPGQDVIGVLDAYPDWQIPARVITTVPAADRQKATVLVRIAFKALDPRILPDMAIKVTFLRPPDDSAATASRAATLVPKAAVKTEGGQTFAFVVRGDRIEKRAIKVGVPDGDRLEVEAGLQGGDRVVLTPPSDLKDGGKIVVK
jgi:RND family efflux transporter MFP subunit